MKKKETSSSEQPAKAPSLKAKAVSRYVRISPRKVRLVIDAIRHQPAGRAFEILLSLKKKAARIAEKTLKTACANAKVLGMDANRLYIDEIRADGGPVFKRFMSRSMGRADRILKRTTHLTLVVKEGQKVWHLPADHAAKEETKEKPKAVKAAGEKKAAGAAN